MSELAQNSREYIKAAASEGRSATEIADDLGVSRTSVWRWAQETGVSLPNGRLQGRAGYRKAIESLRPIDAVEYLLDCIDVLTRPEPSVSDEAISLGLTRAEARVWSALNSAGDGLLSRETAMNMLYFDHPDPPGDKIIDVFICKIRAKLVAANFQGHVETVWGIGWRIIREPQS